MAVPYRLGSKLPLVGGAVMGLPKTPYHWSRVTDEMIKTMIGNLASPILVDADDASSDTAGDFVGSAIPTATDNVIVPKGKKLTVVADDDFAGKVFAVEAGGWLHVVGGSSGTTKITFDTILGRVGSKITCVEQTGDPVEFICRDDADVDITVDPNRISRGIVSCGEVTIWGKPRQQLLPVMHDIIGGETTRLTLGVSPFLGFEGAGGLTDIPLDWAVDDHLVLVAMHRRTNLNGGHFGEIGKIQAVSLTSSATQWSDNDTSGSYVDLTAAAVHDHLEYFDEAALTKARTFGPPEGSPTFGSHANWMGRPWVFNVTRNIKFLTTEVDGNGVPTSASYRRPHFQKSSSACSVKHVEMVGWGQADMTQDTVTRADGPITATTNLRENAAAMHAYDAGWISSDEWPLGESKPCCEADGVTVWGGTVGDSFTNDEIGAGSLACGFMQHRSHYRTRNLFSHNTIGSGYYLVSHHDTPDMQQSFFSEVWSENPTGAPPPSAKNFEDYGRGDGARSGDCIFSFGRPGRIFRSGGFGSAGSIAAAISRSADDSPTFETSSLEFGPESGGFSQRLNAIGEDDLVPIFLEGLYGAGCGRWAVTVAKNAPTQRHGIASRVKFCVGINCGSGGYHFQYTGNYILDRNIFLGDGAGYAFRYDNLTYGFVEIGGFVANAEAGRSANKVKPSGGFFTDDELKQFFVDPEPSMNVETEWDNINPGEIYTVGRPYDADVGFNIDSISGTESALTTIVISGRARDALGEHALYFDVPEDDNGISISVTQRKLLIGWYGYWTNSGPDGGYIITLPITVTHRLTEERLRVFIPIRITALPGSTSGDLQFPSGKTKPRRNRGARDYDTWFAEAQTAANNGLDFS